MTSSPHSESVGRVLADALNGELSHPQEIVVAINQLTSLEEQLEAAQHGLAMRVQQADALWLAAEAVFRSGYASGTGGVYVNKQDMDALGAVLYPAIDPFDAGGQVTHVHDPASRSSDG